MAFPPLDLRGRILVSTKGPVCKLYYSELVLSAAAIVTATPSLLQLISTRLPPPALVALSYCQRYNIAPAVVAVRPRCRSCEMLMLMSTLASTAFASRRGPLAERRCRVHSHVAPNAHRCRCCCCRCHLRVVVVIAATPTIAGMADGDSGGGNNGSGGDACLRCCSDTDGHPICG